MTTIPADRSIELHAYPSATHEIAVILIVRADVHEGTTPAHAIEYISAHLENREPGADLLPVAAYDDLQAATMRVHGRGVVGGKLMSCAARLVQEDSANAIKGMWVAV